MLRTSSDISRQLQTENQTFIAELSEFVTPNELMIYKMIENFKLEDDREYLEELVSALSNDSLFIDAYADFQYNEVLPVLITIRMELEEVISTEDKAEITTIREEIVGLYDNCLITCLANRHDNTETLENLEELIIVALNKDLNNSQSGLSKLLRLTRKYEDEIHSIYIKYEPRFKHWTKKEKEIKDKYILESYNKSLADLKKRNGLSSLRHLESEAIFLLLDSYDHNVSRKFFNLGIQNQF